MQATPAGLHRQCVFGGLRIGMYDPIKAFYVTTLGIDESKDAPFALKVSAGGHARPLAATCSPMLPPDVTPGAYRADIRRPGHLHRLAI